MVDRLLVLGTMEYLDPMGHTITVSPGVLGTVERGVRGADEIFLVGHVRRTGASDTKTNGNVDDLLVMDKMIRLDLLAETICQALCPCEICVRQD
jgi:hypothetical protein